MMSKGGSGKTESVIPFEPKLNLRSEAADPLDAAGQTILDVLRQAAAAAEANNQQAREVAHKLSDQVLAEAGYSGFLNRCNGPEPTQAIPSGIDLSALFASAVPTDPRRWHPVPDRKSVV